MIISLLIELMGSSQCINKSICAQDSSEGRSEQKQNASLVIMKLPSKHAKPIPLEPITKIVPEDCRQMQLIVTNYEILLLEQRLQQNHQDTVKTPQSGRCIDVPQTQTRINKFMHRQLSCQPKQPTNQPITTKGILRTSSFQNSDKESLHRRSTELKNVHFNDYRIKMVTKNGYY